MKAELTGHDFDLGDLAAMFPIGESRVIAEDGAHYLVADEIDNRPEGVEFYDVAARVLSRLNGLARAHSSGFRPMTLSGVFVQGDHRHVVIRPDTIEMRSRLHAVATVTIGSIMDPNAAGLAETALTGHSPTAVRTDEVAALPSPTVVLSARLKQYYGRLRLPPGTRSTSRFSWL